MFMLPVFVMNFKDTPCSKFDQLYIIYWVLFAALCIGLHNFKFAVRVLYRRSDIYTDFAIFRTILYNVLVRSGPTRSVNYTSP